MQFLDLPFWERALRGLFAAICQLLYPLIAWLYNLFINMSKINILSEEYISPIYQRVTMLLTIVMVFYVTFQFVKYIVQPDEITDKEKGAGKIVYKMIAVVVLIAFVPKIFEGAFWVQSKIMNNDLIGKIMLGTASDDVEDFGQVFSANLFSLFYTFEPNDERGVDTDEECGGAECRLLVNMNLKKLRDEGTLAYLTVGLNESKKVETSIVGKKEEMALIEFNYLMATIIGIIVALMIAMYCIEAGVRWAQLVFLQIIAPIPIIGYLSPKKDGIFQKWVQQCFTTYIDLFLRMGIIYFILIICQILTDAVANGTFLQELDGVSSWMKTFIYIALILGTMLFAKKAPKMLAELFPKSGAASGNFGLNPGERFAPIGDVWKGIKGGANTIRNVARPFGRVAGAAAGAAMAAGAGLATGIGQGFRRRNALGKDGEKKGIGHGIAGAAWGGIRGAVGGAVRGAYQGSKKGNVFKNSVQGAKDQIKSNRRYGNKQENGYTLADQAQDKFRSAFGMDSRVESLENKKAPITRHDDALKKVADTRSQIEKRAVEKITEGGKGGVKAQEYAAKEQRLKALQEDQSVRDKEFKVSRFTDDKTAQKAYEADVELAKASVNKSNFIDPTTGTFDQAGYEKAVTAAASKVNANDYSVAYKTDAEAQAAYNRAVADKKASINPDAFKDPTTGVIDTVAYNKAVSDAEASVNPDMYKKGYTSQAEADEALGAEIQRLRKEADEAKDEAVAEYVASVDDPAINSMLKTLETEMNEYNASATGGKDGRRISLEGYSTDETAVDADAIKSSFSAFSKYVKGVGVQELQNANSAETIKLNAEIERIKRQQEGIQDKK